MNYLLSDFDFLDGMCVPWSEIKIAVSERLLYWSKNMSQQALSNI